MVDTVELGITVSADTKDLDQLNAKLIQTKKSVKDLSDEQLKLLASQRSGFSGGRSAIGELANQELAFRRTAASTKAFGQELSATAQSGSLFSRAFSGIGGLISGVEVPTLRFSQATRALKIGLQEAGGSLGTFGTVLGTARGGLIALGAAATVGVVVAMEKASEGIEKVQRNLDTLSGQRSFAAFQNIKSAADGARASLQDVYDLSVKLVIIRLEKL